MKGMIDASFLIIPGVVVVVEISILQTNKNVIVAENSLLYSPCQYNFLSYLSANLSLCLPFLPSPSLSLPLSFTPHTHAHTHQELKNLDISPLNKIINSFKSWFPQV